MTRIIRGLFVAVAGFMLAWPLAQAQQVKGTIYVYNHDCSEGCGFLKTCGRVDVHLQNSDTNRDDAVQCTNTDSGQGGPWINDIPKNGCKHYTVNGKWQAGAQDASEANYEWKTCTYGAAAKGVADLTYRAKVDGALTSVISCANDWAGVCQCRVAASPARGLPVECN